MERRGLRAFLDTHAAIFLWEGRASVFGSESTRLLERAVLFISPIVRLELNLLREVGKINQRPAQMLADLAADRGVLETTDRVHEVVAQAQSLAWTRDPFDRMIVATAQLHEAPLVTRDRRIGEHYPGAVW